MIDGQLRGKVINYLIIFMFLWLTAIIYKLHFPGVKIMDKNKRRKVAAEEDMNDEGTGERSFSTQFDEEREREAELATMSKTARISDNMKEAEETLSEGLFQILAEKAKTHAYKTWCTSKGYVWDQAAEDNITTVVEKGESATDEEWASLVPTIKLCKHSESSCNNAKTSEINLIWESGNCYSHPVVYKHICEQISDTDSKQKGAIRGMTSGGFYEYTEGLGNPTLAGTDGKTPPACHPTYKYCKCEKMVEYDRSAKNCIHDEVQAGIEGGTNTLLVRETKRSVGSTVAMCAEGVGVDPDSTDALDSCNKYYTGALSNMSGTQGEALGRCFFGLRNLALTGVNILGNMADEHLGVGRGIRGAAKNIGQTAKDYEEGGFAGVFGK